MRKQRPIPEFAGLTPDQKTQLYSWFQRGYTYDHLCAMVAQPTPEGFGRTPRHQEFSERRMIQAARLIK